MALNSIKRQPGFLPYGASDPDVIFSKSLKSADDLPASAAFVGTEAGVQTYDSEKGMILNSLDNSMNFIGAFTTAQKAQLTNGGHITVWVEKGHIDIANAQAVSTFYALYLQFTTTASRTYVSNGINTGKEFLGNTSSSSSSHDAYDSGDYARLDLSWTNSKFQLYINKILAVELASTVTAGDALSLACIGTRPTDSFDSENRYYFKDLQVSTRPIQLPASPVLNNICSVGDSISVQMQYPETVLAITGYTGTDYGANLVRAGDGKRDSGAHSVIHRELAARDVYIGGKIRSYGRTSCRVSHTSNTLADRTTVLLANTASEYPTPSQRNNCTDLISFVGTNDAAAGVATATMKAAYQTEITAWIAAGVQRIYLCTVIGRLDADYRSTIDSYNLAIKELVTENSANCYLVDTFEKLGGHDILNSDLTDLLHPSNAGQFKLGQAIWPVLYANAV